MKEFWNNLSKVYKGVIWPSSVDLIKNALVVLGGSAIIGGYLIGVDYILYSLRALLLNN